MMNLGMVFSPEFQIWISVRAPCILLRSTQQILPLRESLQLNGGQTFRIADDLTFVGILVQDACAFNRGGEAPVRAYAGPRKSSGTLRGTNQRTRRSAGQFSADVYPRCLDQCSIQLGSTAR